jgi:hypothetical protein
MQYPVIPLLLCILLLISPSSAAITLFYPESGSVSSEWIKDIANGPGDSIAFATDNGLSLFNGSWQIIHVDRKNPESGPLGDFLCAVESDPEGRLWIGYTNGLQIWNFSSYETINDQQLLKNLKINDLRHRGDEMWVATGNAGLHRYEDGRWTWFKPYGPDGPGCYEVTSIAVDYWTDTVMVGSRNEGIWEYVEDPSRPRFEEIPLTGSPLRDLAGLRSDPFGGVYLFNATVVGKIVPFGGYVEILTIADLPATITVIKDIAPASEGGLVIGTDNGIVFWEHGRVGLSLTKRDGIGSDYIRKVYVDNAGRWWFVNKVAVGYYTDEEAAGPVIGIEGPAEPGVEETASPAPSPAINVSGGSDTSQGPGLFDGILERVLGFLQELWDF